MSQLGDSGRPKRARNRTNASIVLVPITRRHGVPASCRSVPMMNAIMKPTYQAIRVSPSKLYGRYSIVRTEINPRSSRRTMTSSSMNILLLSWPL